MQDNCSFCPRVTECEASKSGCLLRHCANCGHVFTDDQEVYPLSDGRSLCGFCTDNFMRRVNEEEMED